MSVTDTEGSELQWSVVSSQLGVARGLLVATCVRRSKARGCFFHCPEKPTCAQNSELKTRNRELRTDN